MALLELETSQEHISPDQHDMKLKSSFKQLLNNVLCYCHRVGLGGLGVNCSPRDPRFRT